MLAQDRRSKIKDHLLQAKSATVSDLASMFHVTPETIRRDFDVLEAEGFLEKVYGGAILRTHVNMNVDYQTLSNVMVENKQLIAKRACKFILPGDCIFIDSSSTATAIVDNLPDIDNIELNILTNSFNVVSKLLNYPNITTTVIGGILNCKNQGFFGPIAAKQFSEYHLDKAFISCRSINIEKGLSDANETEAEIHKITISQATKVYLIMDNTKLNRINFSKIAGWPIPNIEALITDEPLSYEWKEFLQSQQIKYVDQ